MPSGMGSAAGMMLHTYGMLLLCDVRATELSIPTEWRRDTGAHDIM